MEIAKTSCPGELFHENCPNVLFQKHASNLDAVMVTKGKLRQLKSKFLFSKLVHLNCKKGVLEIFEEVYLGVGHYMPPTPVWDRCNEKHIVAKVL